MSSFRQIGANRRNALREHWTENAVRHPLTSETVIAALEDTEAHISHITLKKLGNVIPFHESGLSSIATILSDANKDT
jgi:hypothetical protein